MEFGETVLAHLPGGKGSGNPAPKLADRWKSGGKERRHRRTPCPNRWWSSVWAKCTYREQLVRREPQSSRRPLRSQGRWQQMLQQIPVWYQKCMNKRKSERRSEREWGWERRNTRQARRRGSWNGGETLPEPDTALWRSHQPITLVPLPEDPVKRRLLEENRCEKWRADHERRWTFDEWCDDSCEKVSSSWQENDSNTMSRSWERRVKSRLVLKDCNPGTYSARDVFTNTVNVVCENDVGCELTRHKQWRGVKPHHSFDWRTHSIPSRGCWSRRVCRTARNQMKCGHWIKFCTDIAKHQNCGISTSWLSWKVWTITHSWRTQVVSETMRWTNIFVHVDEGLMFGPKNEVLKLVETLVKTSLDEDHLKNGEDRWHNLFLGQSDWANGTRIFGGSTSEKW